MREVVHQRYDVAGAREEIFTLIRRNPTNNLVIYFDGWDGFGAAAVLRSIAQVVPCMKAPPPELCFGTTIYIDCSRWTSMRAMQKKIAQELRLDHETLAMFEEQDEEDDFNGVDLGSRDAVRSVAALIYRTLSKSRFMMIFINGSQDEIVLGRLGIQEYSDCIILWTFSTTTGLSRGKRVAEKIRFTDVLLCYYGDASQLSSRGFIELLREEAATIVASNPACMPAMDLTAVEDCFLYELLLHHSFGGRTTGFVWPAHAPNFWVCDGTILQGDRAREVSNALHPEVSLGCDAHVLDGVFKNLKRWRNSTDIPLLLVEDSRYYFFSKRTCHRWISAKLSYIYGEVSEKLQTTFAKASTIFLSFETEHGTCRLANDLFKQCSNLGVLVLSGCAFSFVSPPFRHCHTLRFLGLDHCTDDKKNNAVELEGEGCAAMWAFLKSLWVIDLYYTDWVEILSEGKIKLMANLIELNIEGVRWPRWTSHLIHRRLPYLQHLRIIRPVYDEAAETTSSDIDDLFLLDNTSLEILDLSGGNRITGRNLTSISKASHLQVLILDGCNGLEDVVVSDNSSLRSFSLDGYGPASSSHRTSTVELPQVMSRPEKPPTDVDEKGVVKTSMVSLAGCTQLDKLFLRGLPNLEELNLSGCAIKVLDFAAMVVDAPRLKRLFLLGCEHLHAIKWGSDEQQPKQLELICIDTRPGCASSAPSSLISTQQKSIRLQVHAIILDARFARSLIAPFAWVEDIHFNIRITSSDASSTCTGAAVQPAVRARGMFNLHLVSPDAGLPTGTDRTVELPYRDW